MAEEKLIPVNITVADRTYRLKIKPEEEEGIRRTMKMVNEKIVELKTSFAGKDLQDYISMCLIMYATQPSSGLANEETEMPYREMEKMIDQVLG